MATRVRGELFNKLIDAAQHSDRPLGNEVELRLEDSFRDAAFLGSRGAGLIRFIEMLVRQGAGTRALVRALQLLNVPDATDWPENLAEQMIWDCGYDSDIDPTIAARAAEMRAGFGPEIGQALIEAYRALRPEIVARRDAERSKSKEGEK